MIHFFSSLSVRLSVHVFIRIQAEISDFSDGMLKIPQTVRLRSARYAICAIMQISVFFYQSADF